MALYDREFWEALWAKTLREHGDKVSRRAPNAHLTTEVATIPPARALDAGCGSGTDSHWLAAHGWRVTGIDFSEPALAHARELAHGAGLADRVEFVQRDLTTWAPEAGAFELVIALYLYVPSPMDELVLRLAKGVTKGGSLLLVGHQALDPKTGAPTAAAAQRQVSIADAKRLLTGDQWTFDVAEERRRAAGGGVDAVILARRLV